MSVPNRAWARRPVCLLCADPDRGTLSLVMAVLMVGLMMMAGLVLDGGRAIAARENAADIAQQAARAGADALAPNSLRAGTVSGLATDPAAAQAAVAHAVSVTGAGYTMSIAGDLVRVTVTVHRHTVILSAVGVDDVGGTASATARPLVGSSTGGT